MCFHAGDGNLHPNILFDMRAPGELDRVIEAGAATLRACIELGGSITGRARRAEKEGYIGLLFNEADLQAMARSAARFSTQTAGSIRRSFFRHQQLRRSTSARRHKSRQGLWI